MPSELNIPISEFPDSTKKEKVMKAKFHHSSKDY